MQKISLNCKQLTALESFFGGCRDRRVSVHQEIGSAYCSFARPPAPHGPDELCAVVTLTDIEALCVEADAAPGAGIFLPSTNI